MRINMLQNRTFSSQPTVGCRLKCCWFQKRSLYYTTVIFILSGVIYTLQLTVIKELSPKFTVLNSSKQSLLRDGLNPVYKFIITVATYQRSNKKSPYYVRRAVRSIMMQTYQYWEVFATGDKYTNNTEFQHIFQGIPARKLFLHNLEQPGERNNVSGLRLWHCAGATALNNALDRAEARYRNSEKFLRNELLIAHLDDDDTWHPNHLQNLASMYHRFSAADFVWSKGYACASSGGATIFPSTNLPDTINNMPPTPCRTLHSSVSWKMHTFCSFRYRRDWEFVNERPVAADADMWQRMSHFMHKNSISFYHTSLCTVEHLQERGTSPCTKVDNQPLWYPEK